MIDESSVALKLPDETQLGSWLCQTQVWPRSSCPFAFAKFAMTSPPENVNTPRDFSIASHFMLFPGVIWPNCAVLLRSARYGASVSSPLSVAEPKYSFPAALAATSRPMVEVAVAVALLNVAELEVLEITVEDAVDEIVLELALVNEVIVEVTLLVLAYANPLFVSLYLP